MDPERHESSTWTSYLNAGGRTEPVDPETFRACARHGDFPRASAYDAVWAHLNHMGPNVLWLTEALTQVMALESGMRVLDLGCGSAISSIFLAREFGVEVWAADLWIDPSANRARIEESGVSDRVFPIEAEAHALPFAHAYFDALVSMDSYHYYGTDIRYLSYAAQFVRPGGNVGIVVPGNAIDPDDLPAEMGPLAPARRSERGVGRHPARRYRRWTAPALGARQAPRLRACHRAADRRTTLVLRPRSLHDPASVTSRRSGSSSVMGG